MHVNTPFNLLADGGAVNLVRNLQESRAADFKTTAAVLVSIITNV